MTSKRTTLAILAIIFEGKAKASKKYFVAPESGPIETGPPGPVARPCA